MLVPNKIRQFPAIIARSTHAFRIFGDLTQKALCLSLRLLRSPTLPPLSSVLFSLVHHEQPGYPEPRYLSRWDAG